MNNSWDYALIILEIIQKVVTDDMSEIQQRQTTQKVFYDFQHGVIPHHQRRMEAP